LAFATFSFGGYGLALAALALVVFWRYRMPLTLSRGIFLAPEKNSVCVYQ